MPGAKGNIPECGPGFWAMFPHDEEGNVCLDMSEIDPDDYPGLEPDPRIVELIREKERQASEAGRLGKDD